MIAIVYSTDYDKESATHYDLSKFHLYFKSNFLDTRVSHYFLQGSRITSVKSGDYDLEKRLV